MKLLEVSAWVTASVVVLAMVVAAELGVRVAHRTAHPGAHATADDATATVFALVLAFTFGAAASKYDRRLWLMVDEATAIGDFAGVASTLKEPHRAEILRVLREYVDLRIASNLEGNDAAKDARLVARSRTLQSAMANAVQEAVAEQDTPSVHTPLVMNMNATTTAFERQRAALNDHVPQPILVLVILSSLVSAFSLGRRQATSREYLSTILFIILVALVIFAILDLEQPRSGRVRVPVHALESLRATLSQ
jgi:hypothetical protein